ncbi:unnamed protein product [Orchesella dallaii]|uniref:Uncharacterized protein n=1 Tax=Orchesella dallaii TaxID=48710 RepID=A0ABP1RE62_9HEXA
MAPPETESNSTRIVEATMRTAKECDAETLANVEEASGNYLAELFATISNLRQKLHDEKIVHTELQDIKAGLQGKITVQNERCNQLGVENLQAMMIEAKAELSNAKLESDQLSCERLVQSKKMLDDIQKNTSRFEEMRLHFQGQHAESVEHDSSRYEELTNSVKDIESKIKRLKECKEHILSNLEGLGGAENLMEYFLEELKTSDADITCLNSKLQAMQPNLSR